MEPFSSRETKSKMLDTLSSVVQREPRAVAITSAQNGKAAKWGQEAVLSKKLDDENVEEVPDAFAKRSVHIPESTLDVYARPYIPLHLISINNTPATVVPSTPVRWTDYEAYVRTFAGSMFVFGNVPALSPPIENTSGRQTALMLNLQPESYYSTLWDALKQEALAQKAECVDQALYKVPLFPGDRRPCMYQLHVPGLREQSLRIELGDCVSLRQLWLDPLGVVKTGRELEQMPSHLVAWTALQHDAVIWGIDRARECLLLRVDGLVECSMVFNASFNVQTGRVGAQYRAIMTAHRVLDTAAVSVNQSASWMCRMLFPEPSHGELQTQLNPNKFDIPLRDEQLNYEQLKALDCILKRNYGDLPFLISGPPGTGKTKTLVEIALQLVTDPDAGAHLLVCAPSDPAADVLTLRLSRHLQRGELLRLNAPSRSFAEVPENLLIYTWVEDDSFSLPPFPQMMRYKVVVTTCRDADILLHAKLSNKSLYEVETGLYGILHPESQRPPALHWSALLMDEAAQATEPEALIPITVVAPPEGTLCESMPQVVMAGDERQLGPRTASRSVTIETSLFARLFDRALYRKHLLARSEQRGLTQAMLPITRPPFANLHGNYRSHAAILAVPSALFYHDSLTPAASQTDGLAAWPGWRGRRWPVLFRPNASADELEQDGGGWYNAGEAQIACTYAKSLVASGLVTARDICIMSPFAAQVRVLRQTARSPAFTLRDVNIGPLEAFQGLDARCVILCTTRTRMRFVAQDCARGLGVVHEARRFNVALTRAREALFVIGNPGVLGVDGNWVAFIAFCRRHGLWDGSQAAHVQPWFPPEEATPPFLSRLERQLVLSDASADATGTVSGRRGRGSAAVSEEQAMWASALAAEEALRNEE